MVAGTATQPEEYSPSKSSFLSRFAPPVLVFLIVTLFIGFVTRSEKLPLMEPFIWARADSGHYLSIAEKGYILERCDKFAPEAVALGHVKPEDPCGNTGWFPGYPFAVRLLASTPIGPLGAGMAITWSFTLGTLIVLWVFFFESRMTALNFLALLAAGFFPGHIYYYALFPLSMVLFFALCSLHFARQQSWVASGVFGGLAAFSYPTGVLLAAPLAIAVLVAGRRDGTPFDRVFFRLAASPGLCAMGFVITLFVHWVSVGTFRAFFLIQMHHEYTNENPLANLIERVRPLFTGGWNFEVDIPAFQTAFVAVFVLTVVLFAVLRRTRIQALNAQETLWPLVVYAGIFWLFPLTVGKDLSIFRAESLLLPSVILLRAVPVPIILVFLGTEIALAFPMAQLLIRNVLI